MNKIAVIIVNYNSGDMLHRCLACLRAQVTRPTRVLVVDNASSDSSLEVCKSEFEWVEYYILASNTGFSAANNVAVAMVEDCEWIALLNPDAFADVEWIQALLDGIERYPEADSFASCMIRANDPNTIDDAGDCYRVDGVAWPQYQGLEVAKLPQDIGEVFAACAGAGLYRRSAYLEAGGLCERYFCYFEDVDLGFRLQLRGKTCRFLPRAIVHHVRNATTGTASDFSLYHVQRNMMWTFIRNMPSPFFWRYFFLHCTESVLSVLWFTLVKRRTIVLKAKLDALRALREVWSERQIIQMSRCVPASIIVAKMQKTSLFADLGSALARLIR